MDENLPLIVLLVCLVIIGLIIFGVHRRKRQNQLRASMYRQWRDYPGSEENSSKVKGHLRTEVSMGPDDEVNDIHTGALDDEIVSDVRVVRADPKQAPRSRYADLVVLYVMARPGQTFLGYELLQALSAAGLQYGEMNIFHQYAAEENESTDISKKKPILFSLASAAEPGTFDLSEMGGIQCAGLCAFMDTKKVEQTQQAFEHMLTTVKQLAADLDGVIQDHRRHPLTEQGTAVYRARIRSNA